MSTIQEPIETLVDSPAHTAIAQLQRLSDLFLQRREQLAREAGLTVQQWHLLEEITDEHFMPSMFARRRESSPAAVSKIIRQLLDKRLIDVTVDGNDGRVRRYTLTSAGHHLMEAVRASRQHAIDAIWGDLPPEQLNQFQQFAANLADRMEQYSEAQNTQRKAIEG